MLASKCNLCYRSTKHILTVLRHLVPICRARLQLPTLKQRIVCASAARKRCQAV